MVVRSSIKRTAHLWHRYERHLTTGALVAGFVFDLFIADRPDSTTNNLILLSYLAIAGGLIILLNLRTERRREIQQNNEPLFFLVILQFCFGGLASNLLVLYGRSGTLAGSTLFLLLLGGMLVGNEFMRTRYAQLRFNIVVYYVLLFSYLLIAVPTFVLHAVGTWVFLVTGIMSLGAISLFLFFVYVLVFRGREREQQLYEVSVLVGLVFLLFNALYFLNIIPPVPLSLKDMGVYHEVTKTDPGVYVGTYEKSPWYMFWRDTSGVYTAEYNKQATCFSSVFAPTGLMAPIFHRWERFDSASGKWVTMSRISFPISGGRGEGYRGWTLSSVDPGRWRCAVETQGGALIGRVSFVVVQGYTAPTLSTKTL